MTTALRILLLIVICTIASGHAVRAQQPTSTPPALDAIRAYFVTGRLSPLVGEPVALTLVVEMPRDAELVEWPPIGEEWPPFMVRAVGEVRRQSGSDNREIYTQPLVVILWEPGDHQTPETLIGYRIPNYDDVFYAPFMPALFSVPSVLEADMNENRLRPLKGQITLFYIPWWGYLLGAGFVLSCGYFVRHWWIARHARRGLQSIDTKSPSEIALENLVIAARSDTGSQDKCDRMVAALRSYLQAQFQIPAIEMTTAELIQTFQQSNYLVEINIQNLAQILEQADLIKFADVNLAEKGTLRLLALASQWIKSVESQLAPQAEVR